MRIGVVSPRWSPDFGGAEIYVERFGHALMAAGHEMRVATASMGNAPNEPIAVDHYAMAEDGWEAWYDRIEQWIAAGGFSHVLMNNPLARGSHLGAKRLYDRAQTCGARVGAFHYDLGRAVSTELAYAYAQSGNWASAARATLAKARQMAAEQGAEAVEALIESPLQFGPDFVVSCSAWSDRFIDPLERGARFVLRPPMPADWVPEALSDRTADIGFVNPLPHKGVDILLAVMREGPAHWTYRVLGGGYGDGLARTRAMLEEAAPGRVEIIPRVEDVRSFYASVGAVMFASRYEGYGMAAVEPGFVGTPTAATDYPAILEAVGDGARIVAYNATTADWIGALSEGLADRPSWSARALARAGELLDRQREELAEAIRFLAEA
jgi:glycosyltransferase involved in cell wall biosynthesis